MADKKETPAKKTAPKDKTSPAPAAKPSAARGKITAANAAERGLDPVPYGGKPTKK